MATRNQIIAEARSWIDTPWRHQGRLKGIACDCVGHIIETARALRLVARDTRIDGYSPFPNPDLMQFYLDRYLDRIPTKDKRGADVLWLRPRHIAQHLAILTFDGTMIHAIGVGRGVKEHRFDERWRHSVVATYRFRGVDD